MKRIFGCVLQQHSMTRITIFGIIVAAFFSCTLLFRLVYSDLNHVCDFQGCLCRSSLPPHTFSRHVELSMCVCIDAVTPIISSKLPRVVGRRSKCEMWLEIPRSTIAICRTLGFLGEHDPECGIILACSPELSGARGMLRPSAVVT